MKGKLYLIPTSLSGKPLIEELRVPDIKIIEKLEYFIVETPKTARTFFKGMDVVLQELDMQVLDEHTKGRDIPYLIQPLLEGKDMGLMSDAGCPAVADPGSLVVKECHKNGIEVVPMVGPSSILLSLMASGLNGQSFTFNGYLPREVDKRKNKIKQLERISFKENMTQIFIETPYRNEYMFKDILDTCFPTTQLCVASNVTGEKENIKTHTIEEWRNIKYKVAKVPTIFLILASR